MARTVRDANLDSRAARGRQKPRGKPYFRTLEPGLHLGYRKPVSGPGKWVARHYIGDQSYEVETLATADDFSDADGVAILSFHQAQVLARSRMVGRAHAAAGKTGPLTVKDSIESYIEFLAGNRKSAPLARYVADAFILPEFGDREVGALTTDQLRTWHGKLAKTAARIRTKPGKKQRFKADDADPEHARRRKSTANRILTILKGAANEHASITPPINFHGLRHTWASHAVMNGVPLLVVAKNLGHSDTRMVERHYGHLAPSYVADAIRAGAPRFGATKYKQILSIY